VLRCFGSTHIQHSPDNAEAIQGLTSPAYKNRDPQLAGASHSWLCRLNIRWVVRVSYVVLSYQLYAVITCSSATLEKVCSRYWQQGAGCCGRVNTIISAPSCRRAPQWCSWLALAIRLAMLKLRCSAAAAGWVARCCAAANNFVARCRPTLVSMHVPK
jgi:hypothetical protein